MPSVLSVKQLNFYVKSLLDGDKNLNLISVCGEISNFKNHYSSGHLYFSLKDNDAVIKCLMFRGNAVTLKFLPEDGKKVVCRGKVSLYEKDGTYQLYVDDMTEAGSGDLAAEFLRIKEKLEKEGLFAPEYKRTIPKFPKNIAVVTSGTGAALRDIINIIGRRYPICKISVYPALVQGPGAAQSMIKALNNIYNDRSADTVIIGRGGGSAEDLWEFNNELLARTIHNSPIPVISAVGHETDFSISDFVADLRAPTPSAAAEMAVPDISVIKDSIDNNLLHLKKSLNAKILYCQSELNRVTKGNILSDYKRYFDIKLQYVDKLTDRLTSIIKRNTHDKEIMLTNLASKLDGLSPLKVLARGYSIVQSEGRVVDNSSDVEIGQRIDVMLNNGTLKCEVIHKEI